MDGEKKCFCKNCDRTTDHALIPYLGFRCLTCYQVNKEEEALLYIKKTADFALQK